MAMCGFCKLDNSEALYGTHDIYGNTYDLHTCHHCEAVFLSPYPDEALLAQAYDESYYGEGDEKFNEGLIEKILDYFRNRRAKRIAKLIGNEGKVLDIGCGNGRFLQMIESHGAIEGHGLEMESNSAKRAKTILGNRLHIGTLQDGGYPDDHFDAITLFHVFEHLTDPKGYLERMQKILKPGGILYISFPNIDSVQSNMFKGDWLHLDPPRHLFFFRPVRFKTMMKDYGFETIGEKNFNVEYNPFGFLQSVLNKVCANREVLYESLKGNDAYLETYPKRSIIAQKLFGAMIVPFAILLDMVSSPFSKSATIEYALRKE